VRILLVQHNGSLNKVDPYTRASSLESLALGYLAAAVESHGHVAWIDGCINKDRFITILREFRPDIIGFSVYSYALENSLELACIAKSSVYNGSKRPITIFGGCHPTACPEDTASEKCVDFVVIGEGEETLCELLSVIEMGGNYETIAGIAFKQEDGVMVTTARERIASLDDWPFPKRERSILDQCRQYQISYPPPSQQKSVAQVLFSRGCPFSCFYCSSEISWKKQIIWRDPKRVCDELEELIQNYGTNLAYFPDLTLNADKGKLIEFCHAISARHLPLHWWGYFRLDLLDEEILDALVEAKCIKLGIGVESPIESCVKKIKDRLNMGKERKKYILKYANEIGLLLRAFLMIGLPGDTEESLRTYPQEMIEYGFDEIRVCFATPFPGTRFFNEAKQSGLLPDKIEWSSMTTEVPFLQNPTLTKQQILTLQKEVILQFYSSRRYLEHVVDKTTRFPILKQPWVEFLEFMNSNGVFHNENPMFTALMESLRKR